MMRKENWRSWKKGTVILFSLLLVASLLLAGCGKTEDQGSASNNATLGEQKSESQKSETKTIRVLMGLGENEWEVMRNDVLPAFESKTGIKVEAIQVEAGDVANKLEAQIKANKVEIDLITQDVNALSGLVARDLVEDLSAYQSEIPETVIQGMVDAGTFNGKLLFLPYRPNVEIAYYNENKYAEYGLQPPKTWDDLLKQAKFFKEKEGIGRIAIKGNLEGDNVLHIFDFIKSAGGDPYVLNDEGSVRAFEFLQELWPYLSPDSKKANWNFMNQFIATDSVYLGQNWPFGINVIVKDGGKKEIKAYSGWAGPVKESHALGGEVIGIPKGSPNKEAAIEFAKFLMSKDIQEILVSKLAWPAVRSDAYGKVEEWQKPYFDAVKNALEKAEPRGNVSYWDDVQKAILDAFRDVVINGAEVKPTLDKYANQIAEAKTKAGGK
ncbi:extracellular solute-binding protein [Microaerobacter geothermalis]|uniref:ABC transporter substrate-binding protein n=1 Tax=Microaerobacter geothermalis TaxID=674972 RepID=UPI001F1E94B4|nr:extracellular solute-binding protein [Microaerobacter geothermalis]MCF6092787.1 extracellular solute-binding protein [Microaerobacter geothermalis]